MSDTELSERITLIGGEMLTWSDLDGVKGDGPFTSPLALPWLSPMLEAGAKVLVAGPHSPMLLEQIADQVGLLDILVRSWPDAHSLNLQLNGKPVRILCGGVDRFEERAGEYDLIVAMDGIARLYSADSVDAPWTDNLRSLSNRLRPGGRLVIGVPNHVGLDALLDADASVLPPADDRWPSSPELTPPPGLDLVEDALAGAELTIEHGYAVFPRADRVGLMVRADVLDRHPHDEALSIMGSAAFASGMADAPVLTDPRRLAREMIRSGVGLELASGWLFATTRTTEAPAEGDTTADAAGPTGPGPADDHESPEVLVADNLDNAYWSAVVSLHHIDGGWQRTPVDIGRSASVRQSGQITRDPSALAGEFPDGALLEEAFLTSCRHDDLLGLRRLTRAYADWLRSDAEQREWVDPWSSDDEPVMRQVVRGAKVFGTFENVMLSHRAPDDEDASNGAQPRLTLLDPSWDTTLVVPFEIALTRALRRFGYRVLAGGLRHPWPSGMSPNRMTATMAAMVGVTVGPLLLERATRIEVELEGRQRNNTETGDQQLYFQLQTMGEQPMGAEPGQPRGYREALTTVGRLSTELAEAKSQIEWLDATLRLRESQLNKARKMSDDIKNSVSFGVGRKVTQPARSMTRYLRPVFRNLSNQAPKR